MQNQSQETARLSSTLSITWSHIKECYRRVASKVNTLKQLLIVTKRTNPFTLDICYTKIGICAYARGLYAF